jgi:hypothetical protein
MILQVLGPYVEYLRPDSVATGLFVLVDQQDRRQSLRCGGVACLALKRAAGERMMLWCSTSKTSRRAEIPPHRHGWVTGILLARFTLTNPTRLLTLQANARALQ